MDFILKKLSGVYEQQPIRTEDILAQLDRDGLYTFFDYLTAASKLPHEALIGLTNIENQNTRRELVRHVLRNTEFDPQPRIWKKVSFVELE